VGEQLEQTSLENSTWWLQRREQYEKPLFALLKLLLCSVHVSGHYSVYSSFLFSDLHFVLQLGVVVAVIEKSLQRLNVIRKRRNECHNLFCSPCKCTPDRFSPLVFNSFPFLYMEDLQVSFAMIFSTVLTRIGFQLTEKNICR